ncbi:MAG: hypothetical protein H7836_08175 [Magnetococcus sp. YQC-3]
MAVVDQVIVDGIHLSKLDNGKIEIKLYEEYTELDCSGAEYLSKKLHEYASQIHQQTAFPL